MDQALISITSNSNDIMPISFDVWTVCGINSEYNESTMTHTALVKIRNDDGTTQTLRVPDVKYDDFKNAVNAYYNHLKIHHSYFVIPPSH